MLHKIGVPCSRICYNKKCKGKELVLLLQILRWASSFFSKGLLQ